MIYKAPKSQKKSGCLSCQHQWQNLTNFWVNNFFYKCTLPRR